MFQTRYIVPIIEGEKTATLRRRCRFEPGEELRMANGYPPEAGFAEGVLESNDQVDVAQLDDAAAVEDGFKDVVALREALEQIYPGVSTLRRLRFRLTRVVESHPAVAAHRLATRT